MKVEGVLKAITYFEIRNSLFDIRYSIDGDRSTPANEMRWQKSNDVGLLEIPRRKAPAIAEDQPAKQKG